MLAQNYVSSNQKLAEIVEILERESKY